LTFNIFIGGFMLQSRSAKNLNIKQRGEKREKDNSGSDGKESSKEELLFDKGFSSSRTTSIAGVHVRSR
jgi:hypothetical protein